MADDIKARLREWNGYNDELMAEAADHIETLEARIAELEGRDQFKAGYLIAVANIMHLHHEDVIAEDVLRELGATEDVLKRLDLSDYDAKPLRKLFRNINRQRRAALNQDTAQQNSNDSEYLSQPTSMDKLRHDMSTSASLGPSSSVPLRQTDIHGSQNIKASSTNGVSVVQRHDALNQEAGRDG